MRKLNSEFLNSESMPLNYFHILIKKSCQNIWSIQNFFVTLQCQRKEVKLRALSVKNAGFNSCNGRLWYLHHQRRNVPLVTSRLRQRETYQIVNPNCKP